MPVRRSFFQIQRVFRKKKSSKSGHVAWHLVCTEVLGSDSSTEKGRKEKDERRKEGEEIRWGNGEKDGKKTEQ